MEMKKGIWIIVLSVIIILGMFMGSITGYVNMTYFQQTCRDSDYRIFFKSRSFYQAGSVTITGLGPIPFVTSNHTDTCLDDTTLREYYCAWVYKEMTWAEKSMDYRCPKGCRESKCVR